MSLFIQTTIATITLFRLDIEVLARFTCKAISEVRILSDLTINKQSRRIDLYFSGNLLLILLQRCAIGCHKSIKIFSYIYFLSQGASMDCCVINSLLRTNNTLFGIKIEYIFGILALNTWVSVIEWPFNWTIFDKWIIRYLLLGNVFGSIEIGFLVLFFYSVGTRIGVKDQSLWSLCAFFFVNIELVWTNHARHTIVKGSH